MNHTFTILDVPFTTLSKSEVLALVEKWIKEVKQPPKLVFTPNPEMLVLASEDADFKKVLNQADLNIPDGWGVVSASRGRIQERIGGTDLTYDLLDLAGKNQWRVFLLGGRPGVAQKAASRFNSSIQTDQGPQNVADASVKENQALITKINQFKPDLLFVGFGQKKQETWLVQNRSQLKVKVALGVGGALDYLAGVQMRAPRVVQDIHLEWLWRLVLQPSRWKRQLKLVKFLWLVKS